MRDALGDIQTLLVLGATSDLGQAITRRLVARRCRTVILAARHPEACEPFAAELRAAGATVHTIAFDAADLASHGEVLERAVALAGGDLDVALLAWGVLGDQADFDAHPDHAVAAVTVNYTAVVSVGLHLARLLRRQGHGTIVLLSSVAGERVRQANFVYGSSKAGADGFAQGLGDALAGTGVRVLVVRPGFVHTKMTAGRPPAPFATDADIVAKVTVDALAKGREVVWAPPVLRPVFSVLRHLPRPLWRRLPG